MRGRLLLWASLAIASGAPCVAQTPPAASAATARYFESIRHDPARLLLFLREMPKGGDLHNHLGGAVYAESMIRWATEDGRCIVLATATLVLPPCDSTAGRPSAAVIAADARIYDAVIDAWSMRDWDHARISGHDQFFQTFAHFDLANEGRDGDMVAEASSRAAADHVSYLELMQTLDGSMAIGLGFRTGLTTDLGATRNRLIAGGLRDSLQRVRRSIDSAEARRLHIQHCGTPAADPGCQVTVRYLYQVLRGLPPAAVFAQIVTGFELARADSRFVGFNLVMPEDDPVPMRDFSLHMRMIDFLHRLYPEVHITLHAGELTDGLVPPEGLRFHVAESIGVGHAERIGHGVDVLSENNADSLLRFMAAKHVLVEISLTSNDEILGVRGNHHPLGTYLRYGVPVALSTDDEGVSRSDMTHEYLRAVEDQGLDYPTLKKMARNSIVYSFADTTTKGRLLKEFDADVTAFEAKWAKR